jgi:hypothetical protein
MEHMVVTVDGSPRQAPGNPRDVRDLFVLVHFLVRCIFFLFKASWRINEYKN